MRRNAAAHSAEAFIESQNHRTAWVEKDHNAHPVPTPCSLWGVAFGPHKEQGAAKADVLRPGSRKGQKVDELCFSLVLVNLQLLWHCHGNGQRVFT